MNGMYEIASREPFDMIEANECKGHSTLATLRFRALFNEIGRLRALNAELVAALEQIIAHTRTAGSTDPGILKVARAALSRATESKQCSG
jgi:hypothetical protein